MQVEHIVYRALRTGEIESIRAGHGIVRGAGITTPTQHVLGRSDTLRTPLFLLHGPWNQPGSSPPMEG
jgi:hypothetical protein